MIFMISIIKGNEYCRSTYEVQWNYYMLEGIFTKERVKWYISNAR